MLTKNPDTDATMEFDMMVRMIWFPFRMYGLYGSTEFFSVEELVVVERDEGTILILML
ncbi:hypothetical protein Hanom_Chr16g01516141 [Helianthus anomalus]